MYMNIFHDVRAFMMNFEPNSAFLSLVSLLCFLHTNYYNCFPHHEMDRICLFCTWNLKGPVISNFIIIVMFIHIHIAHKTRTENNRSTCGRFTFFTVIFVISVSDLVRKNYFRNVIERKILSRVGVTYKTGFRSDDWIYCSLYIHTTQNYRRYSATAVLHTTVHRYTRIRILSLYWS
jgi:hypothetical protein